MSNETEVLFKIEAKYDQFRNLQRPNAQVRVYEAYPKGSAKAQNLRQLLCCRPIEQISVRALYEEYGLKRYALRVLNQNRREGSCCRLDADPEFMKHINKTRRQ